MSDHIPENSFFQSLATALNFFALPAVYVPQGKDQAYAGLQLDLAVATLPPLSLQAQLAFTQDILLALDPTLKESLAEQAWSLQCLVRWPFAVPEAQAPELCGLLLTLNNLIPYGHFGLNAEGQIDFLYHFLSEDRQLPPLLVVRVLRLAQLYGELFAPVVQDLLSGKMTLPAALKQLETQVAQAVPA